MPLKRKLKIWLLVAVPPLVLIPVFLLSTPMMDWYQKRIDRNPDAESSRWLQMTSADWLSRTGRPEMAATGYRLFYERYTRDIRRSDALLRYAQSLEDCGRNADAIDQYRKYLIEYPDLDGRKEAEIGINRINNCRN
jgi:hypothetical protein